MAQISVKTRTETQPEYTVYIYHRPENQIEGQSDWEMRSVSADYKSAMNEAQKLFESRNFKKVEIKQRRQDPRTRAVHDLTFKVLENERHWALWKSTLWASAVLGAGVLVVWLLIQFA